MEAYRADPQARHDQDELYFVHFGTATLVLEDDRIACSAGIVHFVPVGAPHHFEAFSGDFQTWVVFWGPRGGESATR